MRRPNNMSVLDTLHWYGWDEVDTGLNEPCWVWRGPKHQAGYGNIRTKTEDGRITFVRAHRVALAQSGIDVPRELHVLHECDNPPCINPHHLRLGTDADNSQDKVDRGRQGRSQGRSGELNPRHKLTEQQVLEITLILAGGDTPQRYIAATYGVSQNTISKIKLGRMWNDRAL